MTKTCVKKSSKKGFFADAFESNTDSSYSGGASDCS